MLLVFLERCNQPLDLINARVGSIVDAIQKLRSKISLTLGDILSPFLRGTAKEILCQLVSDLYMLLNFFYIFPLLGSMRSFHRY